MKTHVDGVIVKLPEQVFFPFSSEVYQGSKTKSKENNIKRQSLKYRASDACVCFH